VNWTGHVPIRRPCGNLVLVLVTSDIAEELFGSYLLPFAEGVVYFFHEFKIPSIVNAGDTYD